VNRKKSRFGSPGGREKKRGPDLERIEDACYDRRDNSRLAG
jgi:hypothetical protein